MSTEMNITDMRLVAKEWPEPKPESGDAELAILCNGDMLATWSHIYREVEYRETDPGKNNPVVRYYLDLSRVRSMLQTAYDQGRQDQVRETAKQLQSIFGVKP